MILEVLSQAERDIAAAASYYRDQQEGLGVEFMAEVDAATALITANPLLFSQVRRGVRCCLLNRFPYGVYYRHHKRRPGIGMGRK